MQRENNSKSVFIYTLSHPISGEIRYVGKTVKKLNDRLNGHIRESKKLKCHRHKWINKLIEAGLKPKIEIIDEVIEENWIFWEIYWIEQFKNWGFNLVNGTSGGEGGATMLGRKLSEETKQKMSNNTKGFKHKDETKKIMSEMAKKRIGEKNPFYGKSHTKETREKISISNTGKVGWNKGKTLTEEHKNKISKSHSGKKLSKESIEKRSQANRNPVARIDNEGNILETFIGIVEAKNKTGVGCPQIKKLIETGKSSKRGYYFKYI